MASQPINIDLQGLQQELSSFTGKFEQWIKQTIASTDSLKEQHVAKLREFQATIRNLEQEQNNLLKRAEDVQKRLLQEDAQINELENELALIRGEQDALPARLEELQLALDAERREAEKRTADFADLEKTKHRKLDALTQALECYKDRLAMSFEKTGAPGEDRLSFVLTHIDPKDHDRKFTFVIRMEDSPGKTAVYHVDACDPPVASLDAMVKELNTTNNFGRFVQKLRQEFKSMV